MRASFLTLIIFFYFSEQITAQKGITVKLEVSPEKTDSTFFANDTASVFRWGKVSDEDLKMTTYPLDTSADAVVLFDVGFIDAGSSLFDPFFARFNRYRRVKILKKSAFSNVGSFKIRFVRSESYNSLLRVKAQVIQPDGTAKELTEKDLFVEQNSKYRYTVKCAFPDLREGSIVEYCYQTDESDNPFTLKDWFFQDDLPVRHSELFLNVPETYEYQFICQGGKYPKLDKLKDSTHQTFFKYKGLANANTMRFSMDSIAAMKTENYVTTMDNFRSRICFQLSRVLMSNGKVEGFVDSWQKLAETLTKHPNLGQQYVKKSNFRDVWRAVKKEISDTMSVEMKIKTVYEYLAKNVSWIDDNFNVFAEDDLDAAFKKRRANSGELNLMLIACLRQADIEAAPMLISTRDNGRPVPTYPIVRQFNHLICYTEATGKPLLLDVGTIHRPMGVPRTSSLNGQGWVMQGSNSRWVEMVPPVSTQALSATFVLSENGSLKGSMIWQHTGYNAVNTLLTNENDDKDEHLRKKLATDFTGIIIDSIRIKGQEDHKANLKQAVFCTIENAATVADDLIYLKPTLKTEFDQSPFKLSERNYPVEFAHPFRDEFIMNLTLPTNYEVEEMPQSVKATLGEKSGQFEYTATKTETGVQLSVKIEVKQLKFEVKDYSLVKAFFNQIAVKQAEQIVLRKKK